MYSNFAGLLCERRQRFVRDSLVVDLIADQPMPTGCSAHRREALQEVMPDEIEPSQAAISRLEPLELRSFSAASV